MNLSQHNDSAEFLPKQTDDELPAVRIAGNLVFVYVDEHNRVCVTVDTEDNELPTARFDRTPAVVLSINDGVMFDNS